MPERWSFTRLALADKCLASYYDRYEKALDEKLPDTYAHLRDVGRAVHRCVELYKEHLHSSGLESDPQMITLIVEEVLTSDPEVRTTQVYDDTFFIFAKFAKSYKHDASTYLGSEFVLMRELPETDVTIEGYPDHVQRMKDVDGTIVVSDDLKSGWGSTVTPDHEFQGEIVSWLLQPYFPQDRTGWRVTFVRSESSSPIAEFPPNATQRLEGRMRAIIARVHAARESGEWPATPGSGCSYCPIVLECRERKVLAERDIIVSTEEEASRAAHDLTILLAAYGQRRAQLAEWSRDNGPVKVGDMSAGYIQTKPSIVIGDIGLMIAALGVHASGLQPEEIKTPAQLDSVTALGVKAAIKDGLLALNGKKTATKKVQDDPRLTGLWVASETKSRFDLYKNEEAK